MPPRRVVSQTKPPTLPPPVPYPAAASAPSTSSTTSTSLAQQPPKSTTRTGNHGFVASVQTLWEAYQCQTSSRLKLIDSFMLFLMLTGVAQFVYCLAVTNYPFNAFIGGFAATVGQFVLCGALRIQVNPQNKETFPTISPERAFGDFLFGSLTLHFFVYNYLG
ncbi:hypothetical protein JCM11641_004295 [Rhodosporidiobolus odoratus]